MNNRISPKRRMRTIWIASTVAFAALFVGVAERYGYGLIYKNQESNASMHSPASTSSSGSTVQKPVPMQLVRHGVDVTIDMYTEETNVTISPGVTYHAWTFDGTVPGPVLELRQGDNVTLRLHNIDANMAHSIDLHAAMVAPDQAFTSVPPGGTKTIHFTADVPGVFLYHCATDPMLMHMGNGMYGAVIVQPAGSPAPTFVIVQSEWYADANYDNMLSGSPQYVVFNGEANRYVDKPLHVKVGQPVRIAFVNAGPNNFSAFHIVGTVLNTADASGNPQNRQYNVQTVAVPPGDGYMFTTTFQHQGVYTFVSHAMNDAQKGAAGMIEADR